MTHHKADISESVKSHEKAHHELKSLLHKKHQKKDKTTSVFLKAFIVALLVLLIARLGISWAGQRKSSAETSQHEVITFGIKTGVASNYKIDDQANRLNRNRLASINTNGSHLSAMVNDTFGKGEGENQPDLTAQLKPSVQLTGYLGSGQYLTALNQNQAKALQKSLLTTYYLGEKTVDLNSVLQSDSEILNQISNTLSVDIFQYLNQAANRSDQLDSYIFLLDTLAEKTDKRISDLQYKINFLTTNVTNQEQAIKVSEEAFFYNLQLFEGENAENKLSEFIGLQEGQVETRAKLGAYTTLQEYYKFFKPRIENLNQTIKLNRSALIAGVKVTEIQNMALPLIIQQK